MAGARVVGGVECGRAGRGDLAVWVSLSVLDASIPSGSRLPLFPGPFPFCFVGAGGTRNVPLLITAAAYSFPISR